MGDMQPELDERNRPLRDDVRMLGNLLGEAIRRLDGQDVFDKVERFRLLCKAMHNDYSDEVKQELLTLIDSLDIETGAKVIKAFLTYFDLINIAEQIHRLRRHAHSDSGESKTYQPDSLDELFHRIGNAGTSSEQLLKTLTNLDIEVVFTAH